MKKTKILSVSLLVAAWFTSGLAMAHDGEHSYSNGICTIEGCTEKFQEPTLVDGWFQLTNAGQVEWISDYVENVSNTPNVKMMNDIDFTGVTHTMIGRNDTKKFNGIFDGQGHRITNLVMEDESAALLGFMGWVRGGTTIKNLIMDSTCSFKGKQRVAAYVAVAQAKTGGPVNIVNCINEATVTAVENPAGAFYGSRNPINNDTPQIIINGCVNKGTITARSEAAAFAGWANRESGSSFATHLVVNSLNVGVVNNIDGSSRGFFRADKANIQIVNSYDFGVNNDKNSQKQNSALTTEDPLHNGELCYTLNHGENSNDITFKQDLSDANAVPLPVANGLEVYANAAFYCDGTPKGSVAYSNTDSSTRDPHTTNVETGFCTTCSLVDEEWISPQADGFYHLSTVNEVEWFSAMVEAGHCAMKVKLDANIDYKNEVNAHKPIGTESKKFFGQFDGQQHHIKGMVLDLQQDAAGFFGHISAGGRYNGVDYTETSFKNVVIEGSVTSTGARCGGLIGRLNGALNNDALVRIEHCGNEADVKAGGQNAGGLLGGTQGTNCRLIIRNCYNIGNISASMEATAIVGWTGSASGNKVVVKGCWNSGTVDPLDTSGRNMYRSSAAITEGALCDLSSTTGAKQGKVTINTENPYASGELCYILNGDQSEITWTQNLSGDNKEDMPNMYGTSSRVYQAGTINCLGASVGTINYNNESGETITLSHDISDEIGMCSVCYTQFQEPAKDGDYYLLRNAGNVEWLSNAIANGGGAAFYAKLMKDIDFLNIENLHNPLGPTKGSKFKGVFDGQGYSIKNMIINRPTVEAQGFFGWLQGNDNTTIKNLIIDSSCSIIGSNKCGGLAGASQNESNVAKITIENVVNEADVTVSGQDVAGIVGGEDGGKATYYIHNVVNTGTITSTHQAPFAGALFCYQEKGSIENFLNLGKIVGHNGGNIGRFGGTWTNVVDLSETDNKTQSVREDLTPEDIVNGKLAYVMGFKQLIGIDKYPSPLNAEEVNYVGDAGYATMYDKANDWALNGGATAYIAALAGEYLQLTEVKDVPAGAAVILKGTYYNKLATTATSDVTANDLKGTDSDMVADGTMYVLAQPEGEEVGFYLATGTIAAGKAYCQSTSGVKAFYFGNGDATSIQTIDNAQKTTEDAIYNIAGQRLNKVQKGINIINGKKVLY